MRLARIAAAIAVAVIAVTACTSADAGWTFAPPPSETPIPSAAPSGAPASAAPSAPASAAPSGATSAAPDDDGEVTVVQVSALNVAFEQATLTVPADTAFRIEFANNDAGIQHNVEIKDAGGQSLFRGDIFAGVETRTYDAPALPAGAYTFICTVHPNMVIQVTAE